MSGFTPGPWVVERADDAYCIANVGNLVIMPCGGKVKHDNAEADARLIAAAPDLLEALELLNQSAPAASCEMFHHEKQDRHTFLEECPPLIRYEQACLKARAALAKARGTPC